ncbi:MAG: MBL fold metallo-hydrolase [Clostridiales bacterium]|jgi:competence protein ComEC|nr:MBL fold metallo-hydrolase [Clostridiales bacterium]
MKPNVLIGVVASALAALGLYTAAVRDGESTLPPNPPPRLEAHFIDVGQGDSMLAKLPDGRAMLIDAGPGSAADKVVGYLREQNVGKIDILIATHPHEDHIGGMDEVVREFEIGEIYMPKVSANTKAFESLLTEIRDKGLTVGSAKGGMVLPGGGGVSIEFFAPNGERYAELNNHSAVTKITYGDTAFLLTGDAENLSETEMLGAGYALAADVLKVGHHGSNTSTAPAFLRAVSPRVAVISVGQGNSYRHPAPDTLQNLENDGVSVYRTDELGTIVIYSDGENIRVGN